MNVKYNIIHYRLNKNTKPSDVLDTLEMLVKKHSVFFTECLFRVNVMICEFEYEDVLHSNRNKNAIKTLLKRYPELEAYYRYNREEKSSNHIREDVSIDNFSFDDFLYRGEIKYDLIHDIVKQIPRPYGVSDLEMIYNGISFGEKNVESEKIRQSESSFDAPVGNYIWYSRSVYGDEKHSEILFATDNENLDLMRNLFFELAEFVPGEYEGTEYHG